MFAESSSTKNMIWGCSNTGRSSFFLRTTWHIWRLHWVTLSHAQPGSHIIEKLYKTYAKVESSNQMMSTAEHAHRSNQNSTVFSSGLQEHPTLHADSLKPCTMYLHILGYFVGYRCIHGTCIVLSYGRFLETSKYCSTHPPPQSPPSLRGKTSKYYCHNMPCRPIFSITMNVSSAPLPTST